MIHRKAKEAKAKQRAYDDLLGWTVEKQRGIYRCFPGRQIEMGGQVSVMKDRDGNVLTDAKIVMGGSGFQCLGGHFLL